MLLDEEQSYIKKNTSYLAFGIWKKKLITKYVCYMSHNAK